MEGTASAVTIATIIEQFSNIGTLVTNVWNLMTANPLLLVSLAVTLAGIGFSVFRMARRAARH